MKLVKKVYKNNKTSGKILVPFSYIGKTVVVDDCLIQQESESFTVEFPVMPTENIIESSEFPNQELQYDKDLKLIKKTI